MNSIKKAFFWKHKSKKIIDRTQQSATSINLTQLPDGTAGKVVEIQGGKQLAGKLEAMGIAPGVVIVKKAASLMKGPIIVEKGEMQFGIGYGIAQGIIVEYID